MAKKTLKFKAELTQLMDIIIHSLYSHPEIFLRELISNACDAIDKVRFESLTNPDLLAGDEDFNIRLSVDKEKGTLTITDNGIGMSATTIAEQLGTIAKSGTKAFVEALKESKGDEQPDLIGQFGVGFYASFMVADSVTVFSRAAGEDGGVLWMSEGKGSYTLSEQAKDTRGTEVTLHLREEHQEFLEEYRLRALIKKHSDFIEHPIVMAVEKTKGEGDDKKTTLEDEVLNSQEAIWLRAKNKISEEEYNEFYKHVSHDYSNPAKVIHYRAEGTLEFKALLFVPSQQPFGFQMQDPKSGLHLYVRRVLIMDDCDKLLPSHLRFIKGVVDCADLPLNVSREMIQEDRILEKIQKNLVTKVLSTLTDMKKSSFDAYLDFYKVFGSVLKEGFQFDYENREKLADLLLFESTRTDEATERISLAQYVEVMPEEQKEIYYITGEDREALAMSPYLEIFRERGQEVLFLTDPIDEWMMSSLPEYKEKKFKAIDKGELAESKEDDKEKDEEVKKEFADLFGFLNDKIEDVQEVRLSHRLTQSAACLVAGEGAASANLERIMQQMNKSDTLPSTKRILELNAKHEAVKALQKMYADDKDDARVVEYGRLLYDQAVIAEGSKIKNPADFAKRVNTLIAGAVG